MGATVAPQQESSRRSLTDRMGERWAELERAEALKTPEQKREASIRSRRAIHAISVADDAWLQECEQAERAAVRPPATRRTAPRRRGAGRPAAARSSARSGDSGDDDAEPADAPAAAREAVAGVWTEILRARHTDVFWEVES